MRRSTIPDYDLNCHVTVEQVLHRVQTWPSACMFVAAKYSDVCKTVMYNDETVCSSCTLVNSVSTICIPMVEASEPRKFSSVQLNEPIDPVYVETSTKRRSQIRRVITTTFMCLVPIGSIYAARRHGIRLNL